MSTQALTSTKWAIDPTHSEVLFKVKHLVISTVTGTFKKFDGSIESENDDFTDAKVNFTLDVNSIDTNQEQRDGHLKSDDFFSADKFPQIVFNSTSFKKIASNNYKLIGELTMKGTTKTVELDAEYGGSATDFYGNLKAGFEVSGKVNRKDFGLNWNGITEAGAIVVSEEVKLFFNVQFAKQA